MADASGVFTLGDLARRWGVATWQIRRLYETGVLPPAARVGAYRIVAAGDVWRVERALESVGYLPRKEAVECV